MESLWHWNIPAIQLSKLTPVRPTFYRIHNALHTYPPSYLSSIEECVGISLSEWNATNTADKTLGMIHPWHAYRLGGREGGDEHIYTYYLFIVWFLTNSAGDCFSWHQCIYIYHSGSHTDHSGSTYRPQWYYICNTDHGGSCDVVTTILALVCGGLIEMVHAVGLVIYGIVALRQWSLAFWTPETMWNIHI